VDVRLIRISEVLGGDVKPQQRVSLWKVDSMF
jgi:hypothetical protein